MMNKDEQKKAEEEKKEGFTGTPKEQFPDFEAEDKQHQQDKKKNRDSEADE